MMNQYEGVSSPTENKEFALLVASEVVLMTTYGAISNDKSGDMTTLRSYMNRIHYGHLFCRDIPYNP